MSWIVYQGDGVQREVELPPPPPWRRVPIIGPDQGGRPTFQTTPELVEAVNAALHLRRPLLLTGSPGSGKSSLAEAVAHELGLGPVLRWHVTSHSTLDDAIYRYDALGRLQHNQLHEEDDITRFLRLGPLGTALVASTAQRPRVLLIDEIDKGELDLPGDLLNALERGEYEIPELNRFDQERVSIREVDSGPDHVIVQGRIRCEAFPFVVMTSNGEREFPGPFLRRCVRFRLPPPDADQLASIVTAHFADASVAVDQRELIDSFVEKLRASGAARSNLAIDQLLNSVFLVTRDGAPTGAERERLIELLQRELDHT